jgi:DNA gyrase subunit A
METIKEVNIVTQHNSDLRAYAIYVARRRAIPDHRDGQKYVHRKILYAMYNDFRATFSSHHVKSGAIVGRVLERYHPHGDTAVYDAMKPMVNWFEIYMPLIDHQGSFGNVLGDSAAAPRYTEVKLTKFAMDCMISELREAYNSVDWQENYDGRYKEPIFLPAALPILLINGAFGIAVGLKIQVPKHNISDVIDATIKLIKNPNADVVLIPDNCMGCDIIEADFAKISRTGKGKYKVRGNIEIGEYKGKPALHITSLPDMVFFNSVKPEIEKLIANNALPQIADIVNASKLLNDEKGTEIFSVYIVLKKGSDPNYVRDILYATTRMQATIPVNFEVIKDETPVLMNYKEYLLNFIAFRKETKFRMYQNRLQSVKTKAHELYLYILALTSGEIDNIIAMIRKQEGTDDKVYIDYLVNKLKVTPLQAKFLLGTDVRKLSNGYLRKYQEEKNKNEQFAAEYIQKVTAEGEIEREIIEELIGFKKEYAFPRKSKIISQSEASGIPEGVFKVIITRGNFIKKIGEHDNVGYLNGDEARCIFTANNTDSVLIFGAMGKVFKFPVSKIPFGAKGSNGVDIRLFIKQLTSDICSVMTESMIAKIAANKQNFIYMITEGGFIKRMDLVDFLTTPPSGIVFTKLESGDIVKDIIFMPEQYDLLIYSQNKVLRINGSEAPYVRRSTKGNRAMDTKYPIDGFSCLYPGATDVVVVTDSGRINRVSIHAVPISVRARAGSSIIKLAKTDTIKKILVCKSTDTVKITSRGGEIQRIIVSDMQEGSSISTGIKMVSNPVKVELE